MKIDLTEENLEIIYDSLTQSPDLKVYLEAKKGEQVAELIGYIEGLVNEKETATTKSK
tara:strand:- start:135 stop:308 length:174 start_codon:yes stop_codon:yes gene_type:complete